MYIIYEFTSSDNPVEQFIEFFSTYWQYRVGFISPENESKVDLAELNAVELSWDVARASKFAHYNKKELGDIIKFKWGDDETHEMFSSAEQEVPNPTKTGKALYELTNEDKSNTLTFLQAMMTKELNWHFSQLTPEELAQYGDNKLAVQSEIDGCNNIEDAHRVMHHRFGCSCHNWQCEEEELDGSTWMLSEPSLEIRPWGRRNHIQ